MLWDAGEEHLGVAQDLLCSGEEAKAWKGTDQGGLETNKDGKIEG